MVAAIALIIVSAIIGGALYVGLSRGGQNGGWFGLSLVVLGVAVACAAIWIAVRGRAEIIEGAVDDQGRDREKANENLAGHRR